jgi:hypothetical protein
MIALASVDARSDGMPICVGSWIAKVVIMYRFSVRTLWADNGPKAVTVAVPITVDRIAVPTFASDVLGARSGRPLNRTSGTRVSPYCKE